MKKSRQCPKCGGRRIWWIEKLSYHESDRNSLVSRPLQLALDRSDPVGSGQSTWNRIMHGDKSVYSAGRIDAYTCAACGYTELYAKELDQLRHNPACGVHLLEDAT